MPKKIRAKGDYIHSATQMIFPKQLFEEYQRSGIHSFDKPDTNIGVSYEKRSDNEKTKITLYVYPAGVATEHRLRDEYMASLRAVTMANGGWKGVEDSLGGQDWSSIQTVVMVNNTEKRMDVTQFAVRHIDSQYICNGYKAVFRTEKGELSQMTIYECGTWFLKIRTTSNTLDVAGMKDLEDKILKQFNPASLTANPPLPHSRANISFSNYAFRDSLTMGSVMGSSYKKVEWVMENIEEKEKASGFPGLYLELHEEGLKATLDFEKEHEIKTVNPKTRKYLDELKAVINSGFLGEFIMTQYNMVMIVPEGREFDFEGFHKWEEANPISINLPDIYYVISWIKD